MYRALGLILAGGIVLGGAGVADAQVSVSVGNPFTGNGITIGQPYGYGGTGYYGAPYAGSSLYSPVYPAPLSGVTTYSSGYSGYYGSGYSGYYGPRSYGPNYYGAPAPYRSYGYRPYGYAPYGYSRPYGYGYGSGYGGWRGGRMRFW